MALRQEDIENIVQQVLLQLTHEAPAAPTQRPGGAQGDWGVFERLEDAVEAAREAYPRIGTVAMRERVVTVIRRAARANARRLAEMAVEETGMGRVEDKVKKNLLVAERTPGPEILHPSAITGDAGLTLIENAPWGVIASVTPSTNPAATVINNAISMLSGGNAVVFAPHPGAKRVSQETIRMLNQAIHEETGIDNLLTCVREPSIQVAQQLFTFPGIHLLVVTGGEAVVEAARKATNKRLIAAGAGNPPVVVDETADLARAAQSIYDGASFDNNIICCDEKEIIAVESIADALKAELKRCGAVEITPQQAEAVARAVLLDYPGPNARPNPQWVGRDAHKLAEAGGFAVPPETRLLFVDVGRDLDHVFARVEQMMPLLPLLRAKDFEEALEWAIILERGLSHTAGLHSRNIDHMDIMATRVNTSLFVKNGPHLAGLGAGGEGWTSMTISTPTGEGVTNARTFVRLRRCTLVGSFRIV
ncbi:acetaldehyde dehydrogenase [Desulfacinum infernum DSM 9756]|uniref:Acetaldehyde dehydrogenase n=1 Tax=Desulfacinum infernum DSM 9756 TaxID=1121391 RepID=A0A1M5IAK2_9BACT|nr:aldehyde dehydrogenase family protein [Desulfacinum infernum]SHG25255.1 acetaldehyde dehydrogenase [Desulfacinum infernum DSM 9756]